MRLAILTPVGPGHESIAPRSYLSTLAAWKLNQGPFSEFRTFFLDDTNAKHGRALARNILLERAYKGWNADWIINLDATDVLHPLAFRNIGLALRDHPEAQSVWGCNSMIVQTKHADQVATKSSLRQTDPRNPELTHIFRTRFDLQPLTWEALLQNSNIGTVGTTGCLRASLSYRMGFLPELPAAEHWEHLHACLSSAPFWKTHLPIVITDRVLRGSHDPNNPFVDHNPRLNASLAAITEIWRRRGRTPPSYLELEDRWLSRFQHRRYFESHTNVHEDWSELMIRDPRYPYLH